MPTSKHPRRCAMSFGLACSAIVAVPARDLVASAWVSPSTTLGTRSGTRRGLIRPRTPLDEAPRHSSCGCGQRPALSMASSEETRSADSDDKTPWLPPGAGPWYDGHAAQALKKAGIGVLAGLFVMIGAGTGTLPAIGDQGVAPTASVTVQDLQRYDGFEDYAAQGQQMENSDVSCFANECKRETASCFTDGSCLKGVTCLGRCKGEQECATRCFAQYGSQKLDSWLTCTLEDHSCVKIPKDMDFSAIDKDPPHIVKGFDAKQLQGTWYKVMGVNKKYDCFDCQKNTFSVAQAADSAATTAGGDRQAEGTGQFADIKVNFRLAKPDSDDFWENTITERLQVDSEDSPRTFHTDGKLFGLTFKENWYITGHSTDPGAEFVFVQYRGHTLQGSYDGGFVYSRKPSLPSAALPKVAKVAKEHGIDPDALIPIDNTCSLRRALPHATDTQSMGVIERLKYEASFVYDLMEWVHPGTIHKYAKVDQQQKSEPTSPQAGASSTTVANARGSSSSLQAGPSRKAVRGNEG